jgi:uncharacterized protein YecA (UPF0149 family)
MRSTAWSPAGSDGLYVYAKTALSVFWPEPQHRAVLARWPQLVDQLGATWDEHRVKVERYCAFIQREGLGVNQVAADLRDFETFLARRGVGTPGEQDLLAYPDLRDITTTMVAWPPDRSAPCWCGSGRKYKQCCRPHGLGTLPDTFN